MSIGAFAVAEVSQSTLPPLTRVAFSRVPFTWGGVMVSKAPRPRRRERGGAGGGREEGMEAGREASDTGTLEPKALGVRGASVGAFAVAEVSFFLISSLLLSSLELSDTKVYEP